MKDSNKRAQRVCMDCGKEFDSKWSGNRICRTCKRRHSQFIEQDYDITVPTPE